MAFDLSSISTERRSLPPRMILLGTPKVGKTTFASNAPGVVLLPITGEEGADAMTCPKFPTAQTFDDVMSAIASLAQEDHQFRFICIDSASALERVIWSAACAANKWQSIEHPGYGKGYVEALQYWSRMMEGLDWLRNNKGMGSILIGHVKTRVFNDPLSDPYDVYQWDVQDRASSAMLKWSDCILFARHRQIVKKVGDQRNQDVHAIGTGERVLLTEERPAHSGGARKGFNASQYEIPLDWAAWEQSVAAAQQ